VISALTWFSAQHHGAVLPCGTSWQKPSLALATPEEVQNFVGRPVKYFPRLTAESRVALFAASVALKSAGWKGTQSREIGLLAAGYEGTLAANQEYFRDYVTAGRTFGRGNLFIYTLPTSALGEVAIALTLRGPTLHIHDDRAPLLSLIRNAETLVADGEADGMLCLWSDTQTAVCVAVEAGETPQPFAVLENSAAVSPSQLAEELQSVARSR
jgi:3-oxoacyl-(acyl-carrier-protein) synthase